MSGRKQDPNDKDGARGRRERAERTGASGQAHSRIVLCGEYSSTCRKVRWRKPQDIPEACIKKPAPWESSGAGYN